MKKRLLSTMLALCLVLTMLPLNALATDEPPVGTEVKVKTQEEEPTTPENPTPEVPTESEPSTSKTPIVDSDTTNGTEPSDPPVASESEDDESENPPEETPDNQNPALMTEDGEPAALANNDAALPDPGLTVSGSCGANGDNVTWTLNTYTGVLTISGTGRIEDIDNFNNDKTHWFQYKTLIKTVIIHEGITRIGDCTFDGYKNITSIEVPNSVTSIGKLAFRGTGVTNMIIPNSVTSIGDGAFSNCTSLLNIDIPNSVTSLGGQAFSSCINLTSVTIPGSINAIKSSTFFSCESLMDVLISDGVETIESNAFGYCGFETISIPDSVTSIGEDTFYHCYNLKDIIIPNSVTNMDTGTFNGCSEVISVILPDSIDELPMSTFRYCGKLANVFIPKSITNIGISAFVDCDGLTDIYYEGNEEDWKAITIRLNNESLEKATIHYNSKPEDVPMPSINNKSMIFYTWSGKDVPIEIDWDWNAFRFSFEYKDDLATAGLILSAAAEKSQSVAESELKKLGFSDVCSKNYGDNKVYYPGVTFGHKTIINNGITKHVFAIVVRGTSSDADKETDVKDGVFNQFGNSKNNIISQFDEFVTKQCKISLNTNVNDLTFFITGHSLGGAVANRIANDFNNTYGANRVFAYTYASPTTAKKFSPSSNLNIFNILNKEDGWTYLPPNASYHYGRECKFNRNNIPQFNYYYQMLTGRSFDKDDAHAVEVYMSYVLAKDRGASIHAHGVECRIACPVDVEIYTSNNQLVGKIVNNIVEDTIPEKIHIDVEDDVKFLYLLDNDDYSLKFTGTDSGTMEYTVRGLDLSECIITNEKIFANVALTNGKKMSSKVSVWDKTDDTINTEDKIDVPEVQLFMTDEDGNAIKEILPDGNGTEVYISRTVTFDANGGTVEPTTMTTETDGKLVNLPTATRRSYKFKGWYTAANGGTQITVDTIFTNDTTVYAQWSKSNSNGDSGNTGNGFGSNNGGSGSSSNPNGDSTSNGNQNSSSSSGANNIANANKSPATGDTSSVIWLYLAGIFIASMSVCVVIKRYCSTNNSR